MKSIIVSAIGLLLLATFPVSGVADATKSSPLHQAGVAKIDITPDYPVRLSGYGNRRVLNEGVQQHIFAKALVIGSDEEGPAVLVTVDPAGSTTREARLRGSPCACRQQPNAGRCAPRSHSSFWTRFQ